MATELAARDKGPRTKAWLILGAVACALALVTGLLVVLLGSADTNPFARLRPLDPRVEVRAAGEGDYALGATGQQLAVGDTVRTDPQGRCEIAYHEGSLTRLGPDAVFELAELTDAPALHLRLEVGQLWQRVARLTGTEGSFRLHTPAATATVAGTVFATDCTPDGACTFTVIEGRLHLTTTTGEELTLEAAEQVTIAPGGTPGETRTLTEDDLWADEWFAYNLDRDGQGPPPTPEPTADPEPTPEPTPAPRLERVEALTLPEGENTLFSAIVDPAGKFAYFGTANSRVVRVDLQNFRRAGSLSLASGEAAGSAVVDPAGRFGYLGVYGDPGGVVKIDLASFRRVDAISFEGGEDFVTTSAIDPDGEFAYFGSGTSPGQVVKVDLSTFERVDTTSLGVGGGTIGSAIASSLMGPTGRYAYFGSGADPARIVKVDLSTFEPVETLALDRGERNLRSALISPSGETAYFGASYGTESDPSRVIVVDLATFSRVNTIVLEEGDGTGSAVIHPSGRFAYFISGSVTGRVVSVDLEALRRVDALDLHEGEDPLEAAIMDPSGSYIYLGTWQSPAEIVKVQTR